MTLRQENDLPVYLKEVIAQSKKRPQILNLVFSEDLPEIMDQHTQNLLLRLKVAFASTAITVSFREQVLS